MRKIFTFFVVCLWSLTILHAKDGVIKIVVLGSSTAAGTGPSNTANAWVNQYRQYVKSVNASSEVVNLAVGGYTTYHVMPSDFIPPTDRPAPNPEHNITKALSHNPDVIIINLPTNDAASNYTVVEQLNNYKIILAKAAAQNVPVFITTTQPRNFTSDQRKNLIAMRDSTLKKMGSKAIDFWTDIAIPDGTVNPVYDSGDGVHLNDAAHSILKSRVEKSSVLTFSRSDNDRDTINVDFGTTLSTGTWNNLNTASKDTILNMTNTQKQNSGISIWIHDAFTGVNTLGTTTPAPALKIPGSASSDSFFGSVGAHEGAVEPTGGLTLSGLSRSSKYTFTFFASRTGVSDNRETQYKVSGKTEQTVTLNAANNTSNTITVTDMVPADNGTILITVGPGPNNSNASKYYFIGAMQVIAVKQQVVYDADGTVNIDFGSKASTGTWNNLTVPTGGQILTDLVNTEGNSTGISLWVHDSFTGINEAGTTSPDTSLGMDASATSDSFFGSVGAHSGLIEATGGVTLGRLNTSSKYSLSFFASRDQATDNRETQYKVTGKTSLTVTLDASNNKKNIAKVANMLPASDGTIKIDVGPGANNTNSLKYYYLGAIRVEYATVPTHISNDLKGTSGELSASVYPNPASNEVNIRCILPEKGEIQFQIYNLEGQLVHTLEAKDQPAGYCSLKWNAQTTAGVKLPSGLYVCRINLISFGKSYLGIQKLILKD